jgi:hypothetical protein
MSVKITLDADGIYIPGVCVCVCAEFGAWYYKLGNSGITTMLN